MDSSNGQSYKPFLANLDQISFMLSFQLFLTQFNGKFKDQWEYQLNKSIKFG